MKRARETQEKIGVWMRVRLLDEEEGFIGGTEDVMTGGIKGLEHGGHVVGVSGKNELRTGRRPKSNGCCHGQVQKN